MLITQSRGDCIRERRRWNDSSSCSVRILSVRTHRTAGEQGIPLLVFATWESESKRRALEEASSAEVNSIPSVSGDHPENHCSSYERLVNSPPSPRPSRADHCTILRTYTLVCKWTAHFNNINVQSPPVCSLYRNLNLVVIILNYLRIFSPRNLMQEAVYIARDCFLRGCWFVRFLKIQCVLVSFASIIYFSRRLIWSN